MSERQAIEQELLSWMRERPWKADPARFERLALALFAFQFEACPPYAALCRSQGRVPGQVKHVEEIPAVPTGAFKEFELRCFDAEDRIHCFRTSGTSDARRGTLELDTLALYEASLLSSLRELFVTDLCGTRPSMRFLAPSPAEAPDSSLSHMFGVLAAAEGSEDSGFDLHEGEIDLAAWAHQIAAARERNEPIVLAGTSFAFVHFLDACKAESGPTSGDAQWRLPPGSRVMETGGFKGRSREVPRETLRAQIAERFGIPPTHVINQYGMTELGSQFYDSTLVDPDGPRRKLAPPWTRVRFVDPETGHDVDRGEVGLIVIHDLANTGSVAALQTADLGRAVVGEPTGTGRGGAASDRERAGGAESAPSDTDARRVDGFDVLARAEGAEQRGCSIAADIMLAAAREADAG